MRHIDDRSWRGGGGEGEARGGVGWLTGGRSTFLLFMEGKCGIREVLWMRAHTVSCICSAKSIGCILLGGRAGERACGGMRIHGQVGRARVECEWRGEVGEGERDGGRNSRRNERRRG